MRYRILVLYGTSEGKMTQYRAQRSPFPFIWKDIETTTHGYYNSDVIPVTYLSIEQAQERIFKFERERQTPPIKSEKWQRLP